MSFDLVSKIAANAVGALAATVFVGFLAYKIAEPPLIIIVILSLALMVHSFYDDLRNDREIARIRGRDGVTD